MKIFGKIGDSLFEINNTTNPITPEGFVLMSEARPDIDYAVKDNGDGTGTWVKDTRVIVPYSISRFQAMSVLEETEIDFNGERTTIANATQNYIDSLDNSTAENRAIKRAWNYANEFERESETIKAIADLLNLSDEYVDNLYIQASKIKG